MFACHSQRGVMIWFSCLSNCLSLSLFRYLLYYRIYLSLCYFGRVFLLCCNIFSNISIVLFISLLLLPMNSHNTYNFLHRFLFHPLTFPFIPRHYSAKLAELFIGAGCPIELLVVSSFIDREEEFGLVVQKNPIESRAWIFSCVILLFLPSIISLYWRRCVWTQVPNLGLSGSDIDR